MEPGITRQVQAGLPCALFTNSLVRFSTARGRIPLLLVYFLFGLQHSWHAVMSQFSFTPRQRGGFFEMGLISNEETPFLAFLSQLGDSKMIRVLLKLLLRLVSAGLESFFYFEEEQERNTVPES